MYDKKNNKGGHLQDLIKKVYKSGKDAFWDKEENFSNFLGDLKLPKESITQILNYTKNTKEDFMKKLVEEIAKPMANLNLSKTIREALNGMKIEFKNEIVFKFDEPDKGFEKNKNNKSK